MTNGRRLTLILLLCAASLHAEPDYQAVALEELQRPDVDIALLEIAILENSPQFWAWLRGEIELHEIEVNWELILWRLRELEEEYGR